MRTSLLVVLFACSDTLIETPADVSLDPCVPGPGLFTLEVSTTLAVWTGETGGRIALGDTDGDGDSEVAVVDGSDLATLDWRDGVLVEIDRVPSDPAATPILGDLDGDGRAELVACAACATGGDLQLLDLDHDGDLDVVTAGPTLTSAYNDGSGVLVAGSLPSGVVTVRASTIGDFDGDGWDDLALGGLAADGTARVEVLLSRGDAALDVIVASWVGVPDAVLDVLDLALADVDGDGLDDVISHVERILYGDVGDEDDPDRVVSKVIHPSLGTALGEAAVSAADDEIGTAADLDEDGDDDLARIDGEAEIAWNRDGVFGEVTDLSPEDDVLQIEVGDIDGDGHADIAVAQGTGVRVYRNDPVGTFSQSGIPLSTKQPESIAAADFDGDGTADVAAAGEDGVAVYWSATGSTTLLQLPSWQYTGNVEGLAAADLDGDGRQDLFVVRELADDTTEWSAALYFGGEAGAFYVPITLSVGAGAEAVAVADADADGDADIFVARSLGDDVPGQLTILRNDGRGAFERTDIAVGAGAESLALGDFDGDGDLDAAVACDAVDAIALVLGDGAGGWSAGALLPAGPQPEGIATADLDGDGDLDLATVASEGGGILTLAWNDGAGAFTGSTLAIACANPRAVTAGQLDDGALDLVIPCADDDAVLLLRNDDAGGFAEERTLLAGVEPYAALVVDIGASCSDDLVLVNKGSEDVTVWFGP